VVPLQRIRSALLPDPHKETEKWLVQMAARWVSLGTAPR
jgi:hypothetical protein